MNLRPLHAIRVMIPALVTIAVLPSLLALLYSGFEARDEALQDARQETLHLAQNMAATQERLTASTQVMLSALALVPSVNQLDGHACSALFREIIRLNPVYTNLLMADTSGSVVASAVPFPPTNLADRKHFRDALQNRTFSTGEYIVSRTTSEPAFPFSYPVTDTNGRVRAVLIAAVRLKHYNELISVVSLPDRSFCGIADHTGRRLFRAPSGGAVFDLGKAIAPSVWAFVRAGGKSGVMTDQGSDNVQRTVAFARLDLGPGTPAYMYMFVGVPEAEAAKDASALLFRNAVLAGSSWILALVLSWVIGRKLFLRQVEQLTKAASHFGSGDFASPTGVDHDAGELGRVAEALDQMAGRLCAAHAERETLQQQLTQAQRLESVGRLAGGVAHDFNNMLTVIRGHVEMLMERTPRGDSRRLNLEEIDRAAGKSADLTRQLLAFARKQTIAPVVLELNDTIAGMLKMLQRLIGEDIRISWSPGAGLWPVKVDPAQIDQLLANLAVNARDAIGGGGTIMIATGNVTIDTDCRTNDVECAPGDYVMLSVTDNGCGMDQETQARLFEPFFTTKGVGKGTGLGLATVYGVVKQNHGFISVYSEPGKGTCFKIYLPRHHGEPTPRNVTVETEIEGGHGEVILLVEDEVSILRLGQTVLHERGYQVIAAATPKQLLNRLSSVPSPALLITDVVMPEMNGRELAERVRAFYPGIKVLFISGYTADVIAHQGVLDSSVQFVEKPFSAKALASRVRQILDSTTTP